MLSRTAEPGELRRRRTHTCRGHLRPSRCLVGLDAGDELTAEEMQAALQHTLNSEQPMARAVDTLRYDPVTSWRRR
jgi:hypothetical protein